MRRWLVSIALAMAVVFGALAGLAASPTAAAQDFDTEVPPGNPVIGSERPGDIEDAGPNYGLWALVAVCLIGAGVLLVTIERWESRRIARSDKSEQKSA